MKRESAVKTWQRFTLRARFGRTLAWGAVLLALAIAWRAIAAHTTWSFVWDAPRAAADIGGRMWPPEWPVVGALLRPLMETIHIATLGTLLAVLVALPLALLAARPTTPHPVVRQIALLMLVASRSINALAWALVLVAILGPGALAGVLAIALRSIGFVGKLAAEALEESDHATVEAIVTTGASRAQVLAWGYLPQVAPAWLGVSVFRWDINVREATILGLVGAGGIGMQLEVAVSQLAWQQVSVIFALILAVVAASEFISARLRRAVA